MLRSSDRLHPLASVPLPPWRDHLRRVGLGSLQGSEPSFRKGYRKGSAGWRLDLGSRLPPDAAS